MDSSTIGSPIFFLSFSALQFFQLLFEIFYCALGADILSFFKVSAATSMVRAFTEHEQPVLHSTFDGYLALSR